MSIDFDVCWWVVFEVCIDFNADISKWQTGQVTLMSKSTSTSVPHFFSIEVDGVADLFFDYF